MGGVDITENTTGWSWADNFSQAVASGSESLFGVAMVNEANCPVIEDRVQIPQEEKDTPRVGFSVDGAPSVGSYEVLKGNASPVRMASGTDATSGTATLTSVEPDRWEGSFRLEFPEGDIAGDFIAERCP